MRALTAMLCRARPRLLTATGVAAATLSACAGAGAGSAPDDGRLVVVTTVSPITSIVSSVAGAHARVAGIVPEGANSHEFEPAPKVARLLSDADVVFLNGLHLEEPTRRLAEANTDDDADVVALGDRTLPRREWIYDFSFPEAEGSPNPHVWTSPLLGLRFAAVVRDELIRRDPAHAADYRRNHDELEVRVRARHAAVRAATATVPPDRRILLTYHDSFPYFARDYGWTVVGAIQPSNFGEPTPRDVARLIDQVRQQKVPAIFGSDVFPSPVLEQIGREAGVRYVDSLRDDDLPGEPGDAEHSWLGLLRADGITMVEALGGDASAVKAFRSALPAADRAEYPQ